MNLPTLSNLKLKGKRVLLRLDLDINIVEPENERLEAALPTIKYLLEHQIGQVIVLGHRGRPGGVEDESLSLVPVGKIFNTLLEKELGSNNVAKLNIILLENLRFNPGEEANDPEYAKELSSRGDVYINDAFGASHRNSASIVGLPRLLPHAAGLHLIEEVENLTCVLESPKEPVVFVISGGKRDKAIYIEKLLNHAEFVLVGGAVAHGVSSYCREKDGGMCIVAAHLTNAGRDITPDSVRNFVEIIAVAGTIVWNGPMGDIDSGFWETTEIVADAIAASPGYKVAGGGDTIRALHKLNLFDKIDFVSTGGGAMLEFLAYGDLPGLEALRQK